MTNNQLRDIKKRFDLHPGCPLTLAYALADGRDMIKEIDRLMAVASEYDSLIAHMKSGGSFHEFIGGVNNG